MRLLLFILLIISFPIAFADEEAKPVFDDRKWVLGWSKPKETEGPEIFDEYVLEGETVDNWSELVTVQFFAGLNKKITLELFEYGTKLGITTLCPKATWQTISQKQKERMWQFTIKDCSPQSDQLELARLVDTDEGYYLFHYAIKKVSLPEDKYKTWVNNLLAIKIK